MDQFAAPVDLGFARVDVARQARTGDPEAVFGPGKTPGQVVALVKVLSGASASGLALATRLDAGQLALVRAEFAGDPTLVVDEAARCARLGTPRPEHGIVCVLSAGTADGAVAAEAAFVAATHGVSVARINDVGIAGVHRVLAVREQFDQADCLIVVAGMDGALPGLVAGLTGVPIIAVPTGSGYGAAFGGLAALLTMLNACAPGVAVCNIDNGYGAGVLAARIARRSAGLKPA